MDDLRDMDNTTSTFNIFSTKKYADDFLLKLPQHAIDIIVNHFNKSDEHNSFKL